jgi:hypothetical protein
LTHLATSPAFLTRWILIRTVEGQANDVSGVLDPIPTPQGKPRPSLLRLSLRRQPQAPPPIIAAPILHPKIHHWAPSSTCPIATLTSAPSPSPAMGVGTVCSRAAAP